MNQPPYLRVTPRILRDALLFATLCWMTTVAALGAPNLPPPPTRYFTDTVGIVDRPTGEEINSKLENFERETSNQILVAIYPRLPEGEELAQYSINTFNKWGVGQKDLNNGAVLFVFIESRKIFICTGRGLEGTLPDAICKSIITQEIAPHFRGGDYSNGIRRGVEAILAATRGEYKGTGQTVAEVEKSFFTKITDNPDFEDILPVIVIGIAFLFIIAEMLLYIFNDGYRTIYTRGGRQTSTWTGSYWTGGRGGSSGGFGGGGFSGGGGRSGGGGAGGSW